MSESAMYRRAKKYTSGLKGKGMVRVQTYVPAYERDHFYEYAKRKRNVYKRRIMPQLKDSEISNLSTYTPDQINEIVEKRKGGE